ncbi:aminoacyl-tRNA hydrolase [Blattabacterium cuenoti]|uniref:aminoacyl-tRNA hydrolase n=1 Tax=Blattabacterium cuenoti TaxID=1653831 RepID=UPI00163D0BEF|nr:aminoacyl-tRNA hydrolase [Blattabacterium cuenoti]
MLKFLVVGLGNPGISYEKTRHNIGFMILDQISKTFFFSFQKKKLGYISKFNYDKKLIFFLKPSTYMNFSGQSVKYWMIREKILLENILIISDDIYLQFGMIRLKGRGGSGGHNGLKNIEKELNTSKYARLRFGIGFHDCLLKKRKKEFYVLGEWNKQNMLFLLSKSNKSIKIIFSFITNGLQKTMNLYNKKNFSTL